MFLQRIFTLAFTSLSAASTCRPNSEGISQFATAIMEQSHMVHRLKPSLAQDPSRLDYYRRGNEIRDKWFLDEQEKNFPSGTVSIQGFERLLNRLVRVCGKATLPDGLSEKTCNELHVTAWRLIQFYDQADQSIEDIKDDFYCCDAAKRAAPRCAMLA